jgi:hypothetical protein
VVPPALADGLKRLHNIEAGIFPMRDDGKGELKEDRSMPPYKIRKIEWADQAAEDLYEAYERECLDLIDRQDYHEHFIARNAEIACRLATIVAVGEYGWDAKVTLEHMQWGIDLVRLSSAELVVQAAAHMTHDLASHNELHNRVTGLIKAADIKRSDLTYKLKNVARKKDLEDIIAQLKTALQIQEFPTNPPAGGTTVTWYRWIGK